MGEAMAVFRCRISPQGPICGGGFLDSQPPLLAILITTTSPMVTRQTNAVRIILNVVGI